MKKTLKTLLVSTMVLGVTLTAGVASAVTYPVLTKTAANFTIKNVEKSTKVAGFEKLTVKASATAKVVTLTNLVPMAQTVQALGGTVTVSGTKATIKYDGATTSLTLTTANNQKIGTVYYVKADVLAAKLVTTVNGKSTPVAANLTDNTLIRSKSTAINYQWSTSGHAKSNDIEFKSPLNSTGCIKCHDGLYFNVGDKTLSNINLLPNYGTVTDPTDATKTMRDLSKTPVISCNTCHPAYYSKVSDYGTDATTGQTFLDTLFGTTNTPLPKRGTDIMTSGNTPVLGNTYSVKNVGASALCITCHEGRRKVNTASPTSAPHHSNEADVVFGFGGYDYGTNLYTNSPHGLGERACLTCHMPKVNGAADHSWSLTDANGKEIKEKVTASCGLCHSGLTTLERKAFGDYDGNKTIETVEKEIEGLKLAVKAALIEEAKKVDATVADVSGMSFYNAPYVTGGTNTKVTVADPTFKFYYALWNYNTIVNDGSKGLHNPGYEVNLLQTTYKNLTGVDVPGATLKRQVVR